jgi:hypothetical protein
VEESGTITVTGIGDIGPSGAEDGARPVEGVLGGLDLGLLVVLVVAVRFITCEYRRAPEGGTPVTRRALAAKAAVVGAVTFVTGLLAVGIVVPAGTAVLKGNGIPVIDVSALTGVRVVVGTAVVLALAAVLALAIGALLRRAWPATLTAVLVVGVPYLVTSVPLLPDGLSQWLLRVTPAAGFAAQQTLVEYPQVVAHYAPSTGYFPASVVGRDRCALRVRGTASGARAEPPAARRRPGRGTGRVEMTHDGAGTAGPCAVDGRRARPAGGARQPRRRQQKTRPN